jgi:hypothetical protein
MRKWNTEIQENAWAPVAIAVYKAALGDVECLRDKVWISFKELKRGERREERLFWSGFLQLVDRTINSRVPNKILTMEFS